jgi:hypothetical protein
MFAGRKTWKTIVLVFVLCAFADFFLGYVRGRSIGGGVVSLFLALFGTAVCVFLFFGPGKDDGRGTHLPDSGEAGLPSSPWQHLSAF